MAAKRPVPDSETTPPIDDQSGRMVGPYRILERLGSGGMGEVFRVEQRSPIRREAALKLIKLGMDTRSVIARFEAERQALALMDHPHIAKVFDAGSDERGRPYFVMEHVRGRPVTEYADVNHLTIRERLELFGQVCNAVQHAHQKGVIHRDLKPGNVLVGTQDGRPQAKVIDFGIAKATAQRLTDHTLFTQHEQLVGTPHYMSPEQANGSLDIDTRTDVYSLGVMLYELLAGTTPFTHDSLRAIAVEQVRKIIAEVDPPRPSTRLSMSGAALAGLAAARRSEPGKLGSLLRGELDWIVMKALEKDRARRYDTPSLFAQDVQRHLDGKAVSAAPPGVSYRARKFVRRHRAPLVIAALLVSLLLLGVTGTVAQMIRARRAEQAERAQRLVLAQQVGEVARQRNVAVDATARADAETVAARAALATAHQALAQQRLTNARLLIRTGQFARARSLIDTIPDGEETSLAKHWIAWEWARATRELTRLNVMESMPSDVAHVSALSVGSQSLAIDLPGRSVWAKFTANLAQLRLALPPIPADIDPRALDAAAADPGVVLVSAGLSAKEPDVPRDVRHLVCRAIVAGEPREFRRAFRRSPPTRPRAASPSACRTVAC